MSSWNRCARPPRPSRCSSRSGAGWRRYSRGSATFAGTNVSRRSGLSEQPFDVGDVETIQQGKICPDDFDLRYLPFEVRSQAELWEFRGQIFRGFADLDEPVVIFVGPGE